jgi:hypothetical protein
MKISLGSMGAGLDVPLSLDSKDAIIYLLETQIQQSGLVNNFSFA